MEIRAKVIDSIIAHALEEAPHECCGLLVGSERRIDECVRTRNVEASSTRYRVDPEEHFALIRRLRATASRIAGAYHSHPHSSAEPSPSDVAEAFDPEFLYIIVSLAQADRPILAGYRIHGRNFESVPLVRVP